MGHAKPGPVSYGGPCIISSAYNSAIRLYASPDPAQDPNLLIGALVFNNSAPSLEVHVDTAEYVGDSDGQTVIHLIDNYVLGFNSSATPAHGDPVMFGAFLNNTLWDIYDEPMTNSSKIYHHDSEKPLALAIYYPNGSTSYTTSDGTTVNVIPELRVQNRGSASNASYELWNIHKNY